MAAPSPARPAVDVQRLSRTELEALDTVEARVELERRKAKKQAAGKAYGEKSQAEVERALTDVLAMFETGNLPAAVAQTVIRRKASDAPMGAWSLMNQLIVQLMGGTDDARGVKQWEAVKRTVKKDARPVFILGPRMSTYEVENEETGEKETRRAMRGFVGIPVYAIEDTEGEPLPAEAADYTPPAMPPLFDVAKRLGVNVRWTHFTRDYLGYYAPGRDEIVLCTSDERTFFHELAHAAHQAVVAARGAKLTRGQTAAQEIVAETCAATLCHLYGLDGYIYHGAQYVASYANAKNGGDLRHAIAKVLGEIQATLNVILEGAS